MTWRVMGRTWHPRNQNGVVELEEFIDFVMYGKAGLLLEALFWHLSTVNRLKNDAIEL